ncbi:MAG: hypothetical protein N2560_01035 [Ignavibacteria bacterium]|nr:hypothetical protein [Ignavibacteria bacterium]
MEQNNVIVINKRIRALQQEIDEQKKLLLELVEKWYYLRYILKPKLQFEYEKIFGDLESELEEKALICSKMERKIELFFVKVNRGMRITLDVWNFIEKSVEGVSEKRMDNKNGVSNDNHKSFHTNTTMEGNDNLLQELSRMYRALVKQLHPDVSGETEFFRKFWVPIQDAYKEKNFSKIRIFYKILSNDFDNFEFEEDKIKKLEEELKELRLMIGIEKRLIERMLQQEPFIFEKNFSNPIWIEEHRNRLKEKIKLLDKQIDFNKRLLQKIQENLEVE